MRPRFASVRVRAALCAALLSIAGWLGGCLNPRPDELPGNKDEARNPVDLAPNTQSAGSAAASTPAPADMAPLPAAAPQQPQTASGAGTTATAAPSSPQPSLADAGTSDAGPVDAGEAEF